MATVKKIDSNVTGLRIAEEDTIGVLPGSPVWEPFEPNSYGDFGAEVTTVARNPINANRQRRKGNKTDEDASANFNTDLTQTNLQSILQGFFFADNLPKTEFGGAGEITNVDGTTEDYDAASGLDAFDVGDLVFASGFTNAQNNGLKRVTAVSATALTVAEDLVDESSPPSGAKLVKVGFQFSAGDLDVSAGAGGNFPTYDTTTKDLTELGLNPGEWIFVGGDSAALAFTNVDGSGNEVNNGFKRIRSISTNSLEVDKSDFALTTEASTTETVQVFFGRVLKNQTGSLIKRRTYQIERTLGAPDDSLPSEVQAQYEVGSVPNEVTLNYNSADKVTADLGFVSLREDRVDGPTALKSGTRPALTSGAFLNTSTDVKRVALSKVVAGDEDPAALFSIVQQFTLTVNNRASTLKGIGVTGGFDVTVGDFEVGGDITAYFADVAAIDAVNNADDISLDFHLVRSNAGISFDLPLLTLSDGRPTVEKDQAITIPLTNEAAEGSSIDAGLDHTLMVSFYDYLPDKADT